MLEIPEYLVESFDVTNDITVHSFIKQVAGAPLSLYVHIIACSNMYGLAVSTLFRSQFSSKMSS